MSRSPCCISSTFETNYGCSHPAFELVPEKQHMTSKTYYKAKKGQNSRSSNHTKVKCKRFRIPKGNSQRFGIFLCTVYQQGKGQGFSGWLVGGYANVGYLCYFRLSLSRCLQKSIALPKTRPNPNHQPAAPTEPLMGVIISGREGAPQRVRYNHGGRIIVLTQQLRGVNLHARQS